MVNDVQGETMVDTNSAAFARRLGNLLVATREDRGVSTRHLVRVCGNRFSRFDLKALEAGTLLLDDDTINDVVELYQADVSTILPMRLPVVVRRGLLSAGGVSTSFAPDDSLSLLRSYLLLIRSMRRQKKAPAVDLRREDVESIAAYLGESGESVVMRLGALMGATRTQRTAMASLFTSGAVVIGLVGSAAAGGGPDTGGSGPAVARSTISATYEGVPATNLVIDGTVSAHDPADAPADDPADDAVVFVTFVADDDVPGPPATAARGDLPVPDSLAGPAAAQVVTAANAAPEPAIGEPMASSIAFEPGVSDLDPIVELDPTLTYTSVTDPIVFVLDPVVVATDDPPGPTTTVDVQVDTGLPPVPGG
jgi:hypothetical protein